MQIHFLPTLNTRPNRGNMVPQAEHGETLDSKLSVRETSSRDSIFIPGLVTCNYLTSSEISQDLTLLGPYRNQSISPLTIDTLFLSGGQA